MAMTAFKKHQCWVTVALFESETECRSMEKFLEDKGFEARTYNDRLLQLFLFLCPPRLTYRLQVRSGDLPAALFSLETGAPSVLERAVHCPSCGSLQVNYPQMTRKFFLPTLLLHLGIIFRIIEHECYCEHCHCMWNLPVERGLKPRIIKPAKVFPFD